MAKTIPTEDGPDSASSGTSPPQSPQWNDHFSDIAAGYHSNRFAYPPAFYRAMADRSPGTAAVWDCGAGNGQASLALAQEYDQVFASEASAEQLRHAQPHDRIDYRAEQVEECSINDHSVDAILAAQAAHWFDLDRFYQQVQRVLRPGGLIVLSTYAFPRIDQDTERIVQDLVKTVGPWWPKAVQHPFSRYESLAFPFQEVRFPAFDCTMRWTLTDLLDFLATWSGVSRATAANGPGIIEDLRTALEPSWGTSIRTIAWPIWTRAGHR
jgi:SAM-dependent methyltransferase